MKRKVKNIIFGASLVTNCALIGILFGGMIGNDKKAPPAPRGGDLAILLRALPETTRHDLRSSFDKHREKRRGPARNHAEALIAALRGDPVDPEALDRAIAAFQSESEARSNALRQDLVDQIVALPIETRQDIAGRLGRRGH